MSGSGVAMDSGEEVRLERAATRGASKHVIGVELDVDNAEQLGICIESDPDEIGWFPPLSLSLSLSRSPYTLYSGSLQPLPPTTPPHSPPLRLRVHPAPLHKRHRTDSFTLMVVSPWNGEGAVRGGGQGACSSNMVWRQTLAHIHIHTHTHTSTHTHTFTHCVRRETNSRRACTGWWATMLESVRQRGGAPYRCRHIFEYRREKRERPRERPRERDPERAHHFYHRWH
jgi:hypothetical protein